MPDALPPDAVRKVARLSRLALAEEQVARYGEQLSAVLGYVERLRELDLEGVEPMSNPLDETNRLDADTPGGTIPGATFMRMAPEALPPFLKVPKVLGDGGA
ncbi:MAG: Asp-tRNA(Asn)/Glu-tRNA(Gln) amidotransferase subunit GatC [Phycisphaerales bacterium]|nr:Asp-tRNA(Asn)/Glu-tRNA(Gln) amidotransferase subunit GatC [Phycisphaerales bacterium]